MPHVTVKTIKVTTISQNPSERGKDSAGQFHRDLNLISDFCQSHLFSGELGWEFYVKNEETVKLYQGLLEAGQEFGIDHVGSHAVNSMRLEKGFRLWGAEVSVFQIPYFCFAIKINIATNWVYPRKLLEFVRDS